MGKKMKEVYARGKYYLYPPAHQITSPTVAGHSGEMGILEAVIEQAAYEWIMAVEYFDVHDTRTKRNGDTWDKHEQYKKEVEWFLDGKGTALKIMRLRARLTPVSARGRRGGYRCPTCNEYIEIDHLRPYCKCCGQNLNLTRIGGRI